MTDDPLTPLPCPFCGSTYIDVAEGSSFRWMVASCRGCGAQSGDVRVQTIGAGTPKQWHERGKRDAIAEWNKRAGTIAEREVTP